ncbi:WxL domain-containing protein [Enterococcus faecalis]|uniref:WxL domain-containing protein n=1 Tax=Enterococcus faecalis TaxID=1351 RepID=UPI002090AAE9|nr:WxL domain-containing protein [Enterococcus faecalis]MCO5395485.1 WxL domain-containing protein [Enterococcus faecalis]
MKQIKFRHLATLGLCCSLLANSFTGITAIAETVTIESSPTAETVASETTETEKKTKVEQTEQTKEAKNQQEHKETEATSQDTSEEDNQKEVAQPTEATTSSLEETLPKIESRGIPLKTVVYPKVQYDFVDETGAPFATPLSFSGNYQAVDMVNSSGLDMLLIPLPAPYNKLSAQTNGTGSYILSINNSSGFPATPQMFEKYGPGGTTPREKYRATFRLDKLSIVTPLKFVDSIEYDFTAGGYRYAYKYKGYHLATGVFDNSTEKGEVVPFPETSVDTKFKKNTLGSFEIMRPSTLAVSSGDNASTDYAYITLRGFDGTNTIKSKMVYKVTRKQVTEKFVDGTGVAITPPTGFTQNKKTPMTNNNFTYTSAKALPDTYQANGKTYKFKGWYKGKTKPATLKTTKTPSYAVTYDGNDDLNVVYEEIKNKAYTLPSKEIFFGYVDEKGELINPANFTIEAELGESDEIEATVLSKIYGTNDTSKTLKKLTIPGKSYTIPESGIKTYGTRYVNHTIPKYYKTMSVTPTATYTGDKTKYPLANEIRKNIEAPNDILSTVGGTIAYNLSIDGVAFSTRRIAWEWDSNDTPYAMGIYSGVVGKSYHLATPDKTVYYYLENRRVTENFVDSSGAKITPPTDFTQGRQTVIDSENFTYTQKGILPYIYKINNKPYVLKGWYKGKNKPAKLNQITNDNRHISYPVRYDDQDDVTVVYDELKLGGNTIQFGFVNEQGKYIPPTSKFNVSTDVGVVTNTTFAKLQTVNSSVKGNYLSLTIPAYNPTGGLGQGSVYYGSLNSIVTIPKYYKTPTLTPSSNYQGTAYPTATGVNDYHGNGPINEYLPSRLNLISVSGSQTNYQFTQLVWENEATKTGFSSLYKMNYNSASEKTMMSLAEIYATGTVNYYLENRRVTENFVDANGTKITPPTGFTQGNQIPMTSDTFKYTSAKALPTSYTADGKTYLFQGWYKGKTKPNTLTTSTTPTYDTTFDDNDDMTAVYKEASISANLTMRGAVDVIDNGGTMEYWEVLLKNTGEAPLTSIKIKPTTEWESGISTPTELFILGTGQNTKVRPITKEQWEAGFEIPLDKSLPVGGQLTINLIGTKVTGQPNQVLKAAVEVSGNFNKLTASDTVRIKDLDQETKEPTGEGFISVPTFDFGQVGVASATKQHGLKKAADYYGNGTRNPYVRISKTQPNWSLTAQLSQPKSDTDSLPTATRLLLGAAPVSSFSNYNQPTELKNTIGTTNAINLTANNAATSIIANQQFTGSEVYQLDFTFDNIKLEVPANQGTAGQQYQAAVTWNLVTGP